MFYYHYYTKKFRFKSKNDKIKIELVKLPESRYDIKKIVEKKINIK